MIHILDYRTEKIVDTLENKPGSNKIFWNDEHHEELKTNTETFDFTTTAQSEFLTSKNLIIIPDEDGYFRPFSIWRTRQTIDGSLEVYTNLDHFNLKNQKVIAPITYDGQTINTVLDAILDGTDWKRGITETNSIHQVVISDYTNPLSVLQSLKDLFELELRFRCDISGNKITGRYVDMVQRRGNYTGKEIVLGKDLQSIERIEDSDAIVTALWVVGPEDSNGNPISIASINNGKEYVEDLDALSRWGKGGRHVWDVYTPETSSSDMTAAELLSLAQTELKSRVNAVVSYNATAADLESVFGLSHEKVRLGDTVRIKDEKFIPALYMDARVIDIKRSVSNKSKKDYVLGDFIEYKKADLEKRVQFLRDLMSKKLSKLILATISSSAGSVFKNGAGSTTLTAKTFLNGVETDIDGTQFTYNWTKRDKDGNLMAFNKTGKSIGVFSDEVTEKATFIVEVIVTDTVSQVAEITITNVNDGESLYTWVKYADDLNGLNMSDDPSGHNYIGFAYNMPTPVSGNNPADYTWNAIEGTQGVPGTTFYTWLKYADTPTSGMADLPDGKKYIGLAYNKTTATESTNYEDYQWALIKGDKGDSGPTGPKGDQGVPGIPGPQGADGQTFYSWVRYADDASGNGMSDYPDGKNYIGLAYNKTTMAESSVKTDYTWSLFKGDQGLQGPKGADGQPTYTWIKYATTPTSGMSDDPTGKVYMGIAYNKTTATESTNYADYSWSLIKGADGQTFYTWIKYADDANGTNMSDLPTNKKYIGIAYNKTSATKSTVATDYTWSLFLGPQGVQGPAGADGQTTYTWIKYADDQNGNGMSDSPTGKRYLGLAFNKTSATESTVATDYSWSPLYDNVQVGGRNLFLDSYLQRITKASSNSNVTITPSVPTNLVRADYVTGTYSGLIHASADRQMQINQGTSYVLTFEARGNVANFNYTYFMRNSAEGSNSNTGSNLVTLDTVNWTKVTIYKTGPFTTSKGYILIGSTDVASGKWFEIRNVKLEAGTIPTDWSAAPEDPIPASQLAGAINLASVILSNANSSVYTDTQGNFLFVDPTNSKLVLKLTSQGIGISSNGINGPFQTAMTGQGMVADLITVGTMLADRIKGGTLTLGGANNANGVMQILNSNGEVIADFNADRGGFSSLHVANFDAPNVVSYGNQDISLYVAPASNGSNIGTPDDNNDGLSYTTPLRTITEAIRRIPKQYDGTATIYVTGSGIYEDVDISGFAGKGTIKIDGESASKSTYLVGSITAANNAVYVQLYNFTLTTTQSYAGVSFNNTAGIMYNVKVNGKSGNGTQYGINAEHGAALEVNNCEAYSSQYCVAGRYGATAIVIDCKGYGSVAGQYIYAGFITGGGTGFSGAASNASAGYGGSNTATFSSYNSGSYVVPSAPETTTSWNSTSSDSYTDGASGWDNTTNDVLQGKYGSAGPYRGCWFFGSAPSSAVTGKTIKQIRVYLTRSNSSGASGSVNAVIRPHAYTSVPAGQPAYLGASYTVPFKWGEGKWVTLPSSFYSLFQSGSAKGIMVYTTNTADYMRFIQSAKLEITYA